MLKLFNLGSGLHTYSYCRLLTGAFTTKPATPWNLKGRGTKETKLQYLLSMASWWLNLARLILPGWPGHLAHVLCLGNLKRELTRKLSFSLFGKHGFQVRLLHWHCHNQRDPERILNYFILLNIENSKYCYPQLVMWEGIQQVFSYFRVFPSNCIHFFKKIALTARSASLVCF